MTSLVAVPDSAGPHHHIWPTSVRPLTQFCLTAVAYALGVWCGQASSAPPDYLPPVWPPNPVLLAALLLVPTRHWWAYLLIPFASDTIWWSTSYYTWYQGFFSSTANSIEVFAIAGALRMSGIGVPRFGRLRQAGLYVLIAAAAISIAASFGAFSLWQAGHGTKFWHLWRGWYLADLLSHLTISPLLLTWISGGPKWFRGLSFRRRLEGILLLAGLVPTVMAVFAGPSLHFPGIIYLPLPFLFWAALRFSVPGTYAALSLTAILSLWYVAQLQSLPVPVDPRFTILSIQHFLIATALPMGTLAAVLCEREDAQKALLRYSQGLATAKDEAQAANRAKDEFLGVLSHELRTPLTPVLLTASLLDARRDLPPDVHEDIQTIRRSVELEARLIDDLLDVTRIARGKLQLRKEVVDVHAAARQAIHLCCRDTDKVAVRTNLLAKHCHACVDPARLQQVFWNLVSNAMKFTPAGGRITVRSENVTPDRIRIEVCDTGIGIAPDVLPKLFTAFEQGDSSTTRRFGGLGLGLAICKAIADLHCGTLAASSPGEGRGATFTLELPTAPAPVGPPPDALQPPNHVTARRPLRILVVEDNPDTLKVLGLFLRKLGHHVRAADTEQTALAADQQEEFDLVISDLGLPDGSGHRLMRELRERHAHLLGIALSGYGAEEDIRQSREAGFARHLTKPITIEQLETVIEQVTV